MDFDKKVLGKLLAQAKINPRLRQNYDLRTSKEDKSQRMLNAMWPGTVVPVHRHPHSSETVICLCGRMDEVIYKEVVINENSKNLMSQDSESLQGKKHFLQEVQRIRLSPQEGCFGYQVPKGAWHAVEVIEPSVIFEAKDGKYGEDGSETYE